MNTKRAGPSPKASKCSNEADATVVLGTALRQSDEALAKAVALRAID